MLTIQNFVFNAFEENTIVLFDETRQGVIIDPGCYDVTERNELDNFITANDLSIVKLLNTHCHIDHVLGNAYIKDKYKVPLLIHKIEEPVLRAASTYASNYGFPEYQAATVDQFVAEGESIGFGNSALKVIFLPGHAPGHVGFYNESQKILISGDVLFHRSIGRTDLPGGNFETLIKSICQNLFTLPDDVIVFPGHGPSTTIGDEKISNPYCAVSLLK